MPQPDVLFDGGAVYSVQKSTFSLPFVSWCQVNESPDTAGVARALHGGLTSDRGTYAAPISHTYSICGHMHELPVLRTKLCPGRVQANASWLCPRYLHKQIFVSPEISSELFASGG
jgi:hypothetical protein